MLEPTISYQFYMSNPLKTIRNTCKGNYILMVFQSVSRGNLMDREKETWKTRVIIFRLEQCASSLKKEKEDTASILLWQ